MYSHPFGMGPHSFFFAPFFLTFGLVGVVLAILPYWFIFKKAGFSPWLSLLSVIPIVNIIVLYVVAFSQWKVVPVAPYGQPYGSYPPPQAPLPPSGPIYRG